MELQFLGANRQVTGSRYLLTVGGTRVLIDCGMFQERDQLDRNWAPSPVPPADVSHLLLTHAHLDHCGLIPRFVAGGYAGDILATPPTIDLARIVLEDSGRIQEEDAASKKRRHQREGRRGPHPEIPLYSFEDAVAALKRRRIVPYDQPIAFGDSSQVTFRDAGHILGSAMLEIATGSATIVFSGDVGPWDKLLTHDPTLFTDADYVIMESTYGDTDHPSGSDAMDSLARFVNETVERGGNLLIPTFAIDRAQELIYLLGRLVRSDRIPRITIFLDSPMALDVTTIYKGYAHLLDDETRALLQRGEHPFQFPGLHFVRSVAESQAINSIRGSCVILAGSGMCTGGRIKHHLRRNIMRPESTVLFAGFQSHGTLGRQIVDGAESVRIHGHQYAVRARIEQIHGLSAHADRSDLMRWLGGLKKPPRHLFLTHGEEAAAESLAARVRAELGWSVSIPAFGETAELDDA